MNIKIDDTEFKNIKDMLGGLVIREDDVEKFVLLANPNLAFNDAMQLLHSITLHILLTYKEQRPDAVPDIYDAYNIMASTILGYIIPDKELRPDLTNEAIMRAENEIIEEKYSTLNREQRREGAKVVNKMKKEFAKRSGSKTVQKMPEV